ncbi:acyltransferase family protein [Gulosibacter faecalis]|uniref:Acyltransferase family protein n=1 Tax=Gulosibacter faecalis TaxID=272240 RepID=A0ABW5UV13_9MICO|nr:acyltransferase family protein [Gulosibacter faecalis]
MRSTPKTSGYIPEVQGVRTVALLLVAVFHIWFGRVSGGVDIFLLVSSYLMTRSLVAKAEAGSITQPVVFLIRKFSRLLPATAIAIMVILIGVFVFMPADTWRGAAGDALGSLGYFENFRLQAAAVDYFNADHSTASPFQHFWSLSIQGQVFVIWAILHCLGDLAARALKIPPRRLFFIAFSLITVASFAYSVYLTSTTQTIAYFDTWARLWEFGAGSLLAVVQPWLRPARWFRIGASWFGFVGMVTCGFVLPVESSFPGVAALWPVLSAALIIVSAGEPTRFGADSILARGVLNKLGEYTYALYLTHWPVLVIALWVSGRSHAGFWLGLLILIISGALAVAITRLVDLPSQKWVNRPPRRQLEPRARTRRLTSRAAVTIILSAVIALVPAVTLQQIQRAQSTTDLAALDELDYSTIGANNPGLVTEGDPVPAWSVAQDDWTSLGADCAEDDPYNAGLCYEIPPVSGGEAERNVLVLGSSHATQFSASVLESVNRNPEWGFRAQVAPACYFHIRENIGEACADMWEQATSYIDEQQPDLVVLFGSLSQTEGNETMDELVGWIAERKAASPDTTIAVLRDNPRIGFSMSECAQQHGVDSSECTYTVPDPPSDGYIASIEEAGGTWVDLTQSICPEGVCRPVVGGVVTYLDDNHMTQTFIRTLAGPFSESIREDADWWPADPYEGAYEDRAGDGDVVEDLNS